MKKTFLLAAVAVVICLQGYSQAPIEEYVKDKGDAKIKKGIVPEQKLITNKSFSDGHGNQPYITSKDQLPKKIALVTFYSYDNATIDEGVAFITTYHLSDKGGNYFANNLLKAGIGPLKEAFKARGIELITIEEALDTKEKRDFYYDQFAPKVSKMGKFISSLETGRANMAVAADHYRGLDVNAAWDCLRAESLGGELASKLGVDGVLSISTELQYDGKKISLNTIRWAINGKNPVPKEDKKYVAQNMCNGYYSGQVYYRSYYFLDKPVVFAKLSKKEIAEEKYDGFGSLMKLHVEKTIETWDDIFFNGCL